MAEQPRKRAKPRPPLKELTGKQRELFFQTFRETCLLGKALEAIGASHKQIWNLRQRDAEFAAEFEEANAEILARLEDEAIQGALKGFKGRPILDKAGNVISHDVVYENKMLARLLAARDSRYRDNVPAAVINNRPGQQPLVDLDEDELSELFRLRQKRRAEMRQEGLKVVQGGAARR